MHLIKQSAGAMIHWDTREINTMFQIDSAFSLHDMESRNSVTEPTMFQQTANAKQGATKPTNAQRHFCPERGPRSIIEQKNPTIPHRDAMPKQSEVAPKTNSQTARSTNGFWS